VKFLYDTEERLVGIQNAHGQTAPRRGARPPCANDKAPLDCKVRRGLEKLLAFRACSSRGNGLDSAPRHGLESEVLGPLGTGIDFQPIINVRGEIGEEEIGGGGEMTSCSGV
jgi:hypothetical protein